MANTVTITKLFNGNVYVNRSTSFYVLNPDMQVYKLGTNACVVKHKNGSEIDEFLADDVLKVVRKDGTEVIINDNDTLFSELINFFFFRVTGTGGGIGDATHYGSFTNYDDLVAQHPSAALGDLAYVINSQGTAWLPGGLGGTFYSRGTYVWNGSFWDSSVKEIANELDSILSDIISLQNHVSNLNNPHQTTFSNLTDTNFTNLQDQNLAQYNIATGKWENVDKNTFDETVIFEGAVIFANGVQLGANYITPVINGDVTNYNIPDLNTYPIVTFISNVNIDVNSIVAPIQNDPSTLFQEFIFYNGNPIGGNTINFVAGGPGVAENTFEMFADVKLRAGAFWHFAYDYNIDRFISQHKI